MNIYISGPMSGIDDYNKTAFNAAAAKLMAMGHKCSNPAEIPKGWTYRECMARDLAWICNHADALVRLKGSVNSKGAAAEQALAQALGLPVYRQTATGSFFWGGYPLTKEDINIALKRYGGSARYSSDH